MLGCDHSTANAIIGGSLKRAGLGGGIVRYASFGRQDINIDARELHDLRVNGIPVAIVIEHEADWLLRANVAERVAGSQAITRNLGLPDGVSFLAADFDITNGGPTAPGSRGDRNMHTALGALMLAAEILGRSNVGFYGSAFAIDWLLKNAPWIKMFWDTEAWSHGRAPHPAACLYQRAQSARIAGVQVDVDEILRPNFGQRVRHPVQRDDYDPAFQDAFDAIWQLGHKHTGSRGRAGLKAGAGAAIARQSGGHA